ATARVRGERRTGRGGAAWPGRMVVGRHGAHCPIDLPARVLSATASRVEKLDATAIEKCERSTQHCCVGSKLISLDDVDHRLLEALQADADRTLRDRSEEHTSELQSRENLVCRLLLEKNKQNQTSWSGTLR